MTIITLIMLYIYVFIGLQQTKNIEVFNFIHIPRLCGLWETRTLNPYPFQMKLDSVFSIYRRKKNIFVIRHHCNTSRLY
jgi:hypothetical protein